MASGRGLILAMCLARVSPAEERAVAPRPETAERDTPAFALSSLQAAHAAGDDAFVVQGELDPLIREGGGGACASAAGIDVLQALRVMAGMEKLPNPHKVVLSSFAHDPGLLGGRVTNFQKAGLIRFYAARHLPGHEVTVDVESAPGSDYGTEGKKWRDGVGPDLRTQGRQIKIVSYTLLEPDGTSPGRHFVLLKESAGDEIRVVDPGSPRKDRRYRVERQPGREGAPGRTILVNPPGVPPRRPTFVVNTLFTVSPNAKGEAGPSGEPTVGQIKAKVDETADQLGGTEEFLSARTWRKRGAAFGLPGLDLPPEYAGAGWPASKMIEVFRHAGRQNLNFRDVVGGAHVRPLLKSKSDEVLDVVRQVARGDGYVAIAVTEPDVGTDHRAAGGERGAAAFPGVRAARGEVCRHRRAGFGGEQRGDQSRKIGRREFRVGRRGRFSPRERGSRRARPSQRRRELSRRRSTGQRRASASRPARP